VGKWIPVCTGMTIFKCFGLTRQPHYKFEYFYKNLPLTPSQRGNEQKSPSLIPTGRDRWGIKGGGSKFPFARE